MTLEATIGLSGEFKLMVHGPDGELRRETPWFKNLITNRGLDMLGEDISGSGSLRNIDSLTCRYVFVGTGSTAPSVNDTQLESQVAEDTGRDVEANSGVNNETTKQVYTRISWQFAQGAAAGNLSEVGVGQDNLNLFSRTLIKDENGDPTTITVLSDEYLTVKYTVRVNVPTGDMTGTIDGIDYIARASNFTASYDETGWRPRTMGYGAFAFGNRRDYVYEGDIKDIFNRPDSPQDTSASSSVPAYSPGTYTNVLTMVWGTADGNFSGTGNIKSASFHFGPGYWQCSFTPTLEKDNTKRLTLKFRIRWAREGELPA